MEATSVVPLFVSDSNSITMAVVAAKENTFMPGGPGTRVGQSNETFYRKRIPITCEEVKFSYFFQYHCDWKHFIYH